MLNIPKLLIVFVGLIILPVISIVGIGYWAETTFQSSLAGGLMFGWGLGLYAILVRHFRIQVLHILLVGIWRK